MLEGNAAMLAKLKQLIHDGDGLAVEFKRCENKLANSVYETVAAFSNRYGGHILLGVEDSGRIVGSLVHREYTSAYPAKIIVEHSHIVTENWSLPKNPGRINPDCFTPYPKNPLLASFFIHIGRADILGSGVRNLYRFTKMYSGSNPELVEGDIFRTVVPLSLSDILMSDNDVSDNDVSDNVVSDNVVSDNVVSDNVVSDNGLSDNGLSDNGLSDNGLSDNSVSDNSVSDNGLSDNGLSDNVVSDNGLSDNGLSDNVVSDNIHSQAILAYLTDHGEISTAEAAKLIGRNPKTARRALLQLVEEGILVATGANRNRKYGMVR